MQRLVVPPVEALQGSLETRTRWVEYCGMNAAGVHRLYNAARVSHTESFVNNVQCRTLGLQLSMYDTLSMYPV